MRIEGRIIVREPLSRRIVHILQVLHPHIHNSFPSVTFSVLNLRDASPSLMTRDLHSNLQGFDEFMNVVIDEAVEVFIKEAKPRRELGAWHTSSHCCHANPL